MPTRQKLLLLTIVSLLMFGFADKWDWLESLPEPWTQSAGEITTLLPEFHRNFPDFNERLKAFAIWRVGTPYEIFKLGEEREPDPDPIIRLDVSDCTGHILTSLAFVQAHSWEEARTNMINIHYKSDESGKKVPTYKTRWHYTTDRIIHNPNTVNITEELVVADRLETVNLTLNRKKDGSEFLDLCWSREVTVKIIPNNAINSELLGRLPLICGVAFVRKSYFEKGIIMGHEGMIVDGKDIIHASQSAGETVRVNFLDYYFQNDRPIFDGIMIYKFVPLKI